jgi:hypothetical protein
VPSDGWRPESDSAVVGVSPAIASGVVLTSLRKVRLTTTAVVEANQTITFEVTKVMNPSSVTGVAQMLVATKDVNGGLIDGPTNVITDEITAGALEAPMSWVAGERAPGVTGAATLTFNVSGSIGVGGKVVMVLPNASTVGCDSSWAMPNAPLIAVLSPSGILASAMWTASTQTLEITTAGTDVVEGARIMLTVRGVRTPSCAHHSTSVFVRSLDPAGSTIDASTGIAISSITAGQLTGELEWAAVRPIAAVTSDSIVQFTASGGIPAHGLITIVLPEDGWDMSSTTPEVQFIKPSSAVEATSTWNATANTLVLTLTSTIGESQLVMMKVLSTRTPTSVQRAHIATVYTTDPYMQPIDGPTAMNVSAIGSTSHVGGLLWNPVHDTAATETNVEISFIHVGSIEEGGFVRITLQDVGWAFTSPTPIVRFQLPTNLTATTASATWSASDSTLEVQIASGAVDENTEVRFEVVGVVTPSAVRPASTANLRTYTKEHQFVHGPTTMLVQPVVAGGLKGMLTWEPAIETPGVTSAANVSFRTNGRLDSDASIVIGLPCGWTMPAHPTVTFANPPGVTASATSFSSGDRGSTLKVVLDASTSSDQLPTGSHLQFTVSDVTTPKQLQSVGVGMVSTMAAPSTCANISSGNCLTDGPTAISFSATEQATFKVQTTSNRPMYVAPGSMMETFEIQVINPRLSCTDSYRQDNDVGAYTQGCLHRTGPDTEYDDVECEMLVQEVYRPVYNPDGSFRDLAHQSLDLVQIVTASESAAMLGGDRVRAMLVHGNGTSIFGPTRLIADPGSTVKFQMNCWSGDTSGTLGSKYTFEPVSVQVKVRRYKLQLLVAPPYWVFGSSMRGASINADHVRDAHFFGMSVRLALDEGQDEPSEGYTYSQLIGDNANSTKCVVQVRVGAASVSSGYTARMLTSHSVEPVVSRAGVAYFRDMAVFAGATPAPDVTYDTNQFSSELQIMRSLPRSDQQVFFDVQCKWGGDETLSLPPLVGDSASGASSGIQQLNAKWKYAPPATIQSSVSIGVCANDNCPGAEFLIIEVTNQTNHTHLELPYAQCKLSIWKAIVLEKLVIDNGVETSEIDDFIRPKLSGVVEMQVEQGIAIFNPTHILAQLGSELILRAICHAATWMEPIFTPTMKVGSIILQWVRAPPKLVKLGSPSVLNRFRTTDVSGETSDTPIQVRFWDEDANKIWDDEDCLSCCTVRVSSSFYPYQRLGIDLNDDTVVNKYKVVDGDIGSVFDGVATFDNLVVGVDNSAVQFGDDIEFRVSCNFKNDKKIPMQALYYPDLTSKPDVKKEGSSTLQYIRTAVVKAPLGAVRTEIPLIDEGQQFRLEIQKQLVDGSWVKDQDDVSTECRASVDYGDWTATPPVCVDGSLCMCGADRSVRAVTVTSCTDGTCSDGAHCTCPGAHGVGNTLCLDKTIIDVNTVGDVNHFEYFQYSQVVTESTLANTGTSAVRSRQVGAGVGSSTGTEKGADRGEVNFADLAFTKIKVGASDQGFVEFQGVGGDLVVSFLCKGATELPVVFNKVLIKKCGDGEEPSIDKARCNTCNQYSFKVGDSPKCMPCPGRELRCDTCSVTRYAQAESNGPRTSCLCPYEYFAASCPVTLRASGSIWCEKLQFETDEEAAARRVDGTGTHADLEADGGVVEPHFQTAQHWGHICAKCPTGGLCNRRGTTFNNMQADASFWQDKTSFQFSNRFNNDEESLSFAKCAVMKDGTSACTGGEYSLEKGEGKITTNCNQVNLTNQTDILPDFRRYDVDGDGIINSRELEPYRIVNNLLPENTRLDRTNTSFLNCTKSTHNGCIDHHYGPLCDRCDEGYVKNADGACELCPDDGIDMNKYYYMGGIFVFVVALIVLFRQKIKEKVASSKEGIGAWFEKIVEGTMADKGKGMEGLSEEDQEDLMQMRKEDFLDDFMDKVSRKFKIFVSFLQVVSSFTANFGTIEWPPAVREMNANFQFVNINLFSSTDALCTTRFTFLDTFVVSTMWPIIFCFTIYSAHRVCKHLKKFFLQEEKWVYKICLQVLFLVYPSTSNTILRMFTCIEPGADGNKYLQADTRIRCNAVCDSNGENCYEVEEALFMGTVHASYATLHKMALIMILVYPIGFPLMSYMVLRYNHLDLFVRRFARKQRIVSELHGEGVIRKVHFAVHTDGTEDHNAFTYDVNFDHPPLKAIKVPKELLMPLEGYPGLYCDHEGHFIEIDEEWGDKLGFLFDSYEPQFWWWEEVEMVRKLVLTGIIVFIKPDTPLQMAAGCMLSLLMIIINANFKPYLEEEDDLIQLTCSVAIFTSYFSGFMLCFQKYEIEGYDVGENFGLMMVFINLIPVFVGLYILAVAFISPFCGVVNAKAFERTALKKYEASQKEAKERWTNVKVEDQSHSTFYKASKEARQKSRPSSKQIKAQSKGWAAASAAVMHRNGPSKLPRNKSERMTMRQTLKSSENVRKIQRSSMLSSAANVRQARGRSDSDSSSGSDSGSSFDDSTDWTSSEEEVNAVDETNAVTNPMQIESSPGHHKRNHHKHGHHKDRQQHDEDVETEEQRARRHIGTLQTHAKGMGHETSAVKIMRQDFPDVGKMVRLHGLRERRWNHKVAVVRSKTVNGRYRVQIWGDGRQILCEERNMTVILSKKEKEAKRRAEQALHQTAVLAGEATPSRPEDVFVETPRVQVNARTSGLDVSNPLRVNEEHAPMPAPAPIAAVPKAVAERAARKKIRQSSKPQPMTQSSSELLKSRSMQHPSVSEATDAHTRNAHPPMGASRLFKVSKGTASPAAPFDRKLETKQPQDPVGSKARKVPASGKSSQHSKPKVSKPKPIRSRAMLVKSGAAQTAGSGAVPPSTPPPMPPPMPPPTPPLMPTSTDPRTGPVTNMRKVSNERHAI